MIIYSVGYSFQIVWLSALQLGWRVTINCRDRDIRARVLGLDIVWTSGSRRWSHLDDPSQRSTTACSEILKPSWGNFERVWRRKASAVATSSRRTTWQAHVKQRYSYNKVVNGDPINDRIRSRGLSGRCGYCATLSVVSSTTMILQRGLGRISCCIEERDPEEFLK